MATKLQKSEKITRHAEADRKRKDAVKPGSADQHHRKRGASATTPDKRDLYIDVIESPCACRGSSLAGQRHRQRSSTVPGQHRRRSMSWPTSTA